MLGQDQQNLGLYLTIKSLVLERTEGCLLRVETFVYRHFSDPVCHGLEDVSIKLIDRVSREESALWDK